MSDRIHRRLRAAVLGGAALACAVALPALAQDRPPAELARALESYRQATMHNDTATLAKLLTDNYMLVNSDTSVQDKTSYLNDFKVPGFSMDPYEIQEPFYRAAKDAALTGGIFPLGWSQEGRHETRKLRIIHYWVKQQGKWLISYTQLTRFPEPPK